MQYEKMLGICCGLLAASSVQAQVRDDYATVVAQTDTPKWIVTYSDGGQETYQPEWRATLTVQREQTGRVARPLQGDLVDTRACRWAIHGRIERSLRLCTRAGCSATVEPSAALPHPGVVITLAPRHREPPPLSERILHLTPDSCNETDARFRAEVETLRAQLLERFQEQVAMGRQELAAELAQLPGVQAVAEAP